MQNIVPLHYRLAIEPDLVRFEFKGRAGITFRAQRPVAAVVLHCLELTPGDCRLTFEGATADCAFETHPEREELHVTLPRPLAGEFELEIDYTGRINDRMCGFYRSVYKAGSEKRHLAVTQFQESDARRAFPCLDHPARKAVFTVEMVIDKNLTAIANTGINTITDLDDGRRIGLDRRAVGVGDGAGSGLGGGTGHHCSPARR